MFSNARYEDGEIDVLDHFSEMEGDKLDFSGIFSEEHPLDGLISDYITATENNGNTVISVDKDGLGTNYQFQDTVVLSNTTNIDVVDMINQGKVLM